MKNIVFLIFTLILLLCSRQEAASSGDEKKAQGPALFSKGEAVIYDIKSVGFLKAGEAKLSFEGEQKLDGKDVFLIIFASKAMNFFDEERIYADAKTFYPVRVERNLNIFGRKEKITEDYDHIKGLISITKTEGKKKSEQIIEKKGNVDNIYCFIYRYRKTGDFKIGDSFLLKLPTTDVKIRLEKTTKLKTARQTFDAYYMESDPAKYKIWFDAGEKKIPLRINGSVGINAATLTMSEYQEGKE